MLRITHLQNIFPVMKYLSQALKYLKTGKAPGFDGIQPEYLIYLGKYLDVVILCALVAFLTYWSDLK